MPRYAVIVAVALLALNGALHGVWTHRWDTWSDAGPRAERIKNLPLQVGEWEGERVETDALTLPEEQVGRGESVRFRNRTTGADVTVFVTCGPTDGVVAHTPQACYPANGFRCPVPDLRVSVPGPDGSSAEFWASNFSKPDATVPVHLRVLWSWSDGTGWRVPGNPLRAFRRTPVLYKCYVIRQVVTPDEPLEGDPGLALLAVLLPRLDTVLAGER